MLRLENITKRYGDQFAVDSIDLAMESGRTYVLIGPSGCGKSTLLRLMMGLLTPTTGIVYIGGNAITATTIRSERKKIGYVVQSEGLFPHLTARQNISLMARHLRWTETRINERIDELTQLAHLRIDTLDRFPSQISGGQQQRVSLMRALMLDPDVLLLDEPLGALDPMIRSELQTDLRQIFRSLQKTVVLVTHDLGEAAYFADRIILLKSGQIIQSGTIDDFLHRPADDFVARFVQAQRTLQVGGRES